MLRTHTCGELSEKNKGEKVILCGWVDSIRPYGKVNFINLRDRYGITQVVFPEDFPLFKELKNEFVIRVEGKARVRPNPNKDIPTGKIEVVCDKVEIINKCDVLPLDSNVESTEETRLKYRYLDLRMPKNMKKIVFRHEAANAAREFLYKNNFIEIETPLLIKSTPEGARDYVVPSRVSKGEFYALPQSPQLYKQLLMVAGFDRYYQIAKCLRDEDLRADRQPEHTQIDLEMSFMDSAEIRGIIEDMIKHIFKKMLNLKLEGFPTLSYAESMKKYGTDKPDTRFGLELNDVTEAMKKSSFNIFSKAEYVGCLAVDTDLPRKHIDRLTETAKLYKAKGLAYTKVKNKQFEEGVSKFIDKKIQEKIIKDMKLKDNQTLLFVADNKKAAQTALGHIRAALRDELGLIKKEEFRFVWITDFPLFAYNEEEKRWGPEHHMFSMPKKEFLGDFEKRPGEVIGDLWDLTLNGVEIGSGSIRISNPELQKRIMKFVGVDEKDAEERFGFLLNAYKYGGPVHGGMGIGFDRLVALMQNIHDIREVIAFPKNKDAKDLMAGAPSKIPDEQLRELGIRV